MTPIASTPRQLKALYPYQFTEPLISESYPRGWFPLFSNLCGVIDELLGDNKHGFKWRQIKEKHGCGRFQYTLGFFDKESDDPDADKYVSTFEEEKIADQLALLAHGASRLTSHICLACGQAGTIQSHEGYELAVCDAHQTQRLAGRWVQDFYLDDGLDQ
jgi:hypothetical protein